jgi:hypothetical protein
LAALAIGQVPVVDARHVGRPLDEAEPAVAVDVTGRQAAAEALLCAVGLGESASGLPSVKVSHRMAAFYARKFTVRLNRARKGR